MGLRHGVVVVAQGPDVRSMLGSWFSKAGYEVVIASTFAEAKELLPLGPDMVVSELKLGEYNGLHIAAHAQNLGIPAIVIGPRDIGLERDAEQLGALYLSDVRKQDLLAVVEHELASHQLEHDAGINMRFLPLRRRRMMQFSLPGRSLLAN
jgi:DNA-binding NtrC family response regulator